MAIYLQPNCIEICQEIRPLTSEEIYKITNNLNLNLAENGLQTWLTPPIRSRVFAIDNTAHLFRIKAVNMTRCKWWNSCLVFDIHLICSEYGSKSD